MYSKRPEEYESLTMYEYFGRLRFVRKRPVSVRQKEAVVLMNPPLTLTGRSTPEQRESWFRQRLLVFSAWRGSEQQLKAGCPTWEAAFKQQRPNCPLRIANFDNSLHQQATESKADEVEPELAAETAESCGPARLNVHCDQPDWVLHLESWKEAADKFNEDARDLLAGDSFDWSSLAAGFPVDEVAHFTDSLDDAATDAEDSDLPAVDPNQLNADQRRVFDFVKRSLVESETPAPVHFIVHGKAGTGKSFLISALQNLLPRQCLLMAPTGVAAFNIGGSTLHSALRLPAALGANRRDSCSDETLATLQRELQHVRLIIIDEFSMLGKPMLGRVHARLQLVFPDCRDQPFGGRSVMLTGDLRQLKPVRVPGLYTRSSTKSDVHGNAGGTLYRDCFRRVFFLDTLVRQASDAAFGDLLERVRDGRVSQADCDLLMTRRVPDPQTLPADCSLLVTTNEAGDRLNRVRLRQLKAPDNPVCIVNPKSTARAKEQKTQPQRFIVGARVMLLRNLSVRHGLVNGSIGLLRSICFAAGAKPPSMPDCVFVEFDDYRGPALLDAAGRRVVPVRPIGMDGATCLPLQLAWAMTVHKSQGLTLGRVFIDLARLGSRPTDGLVYTAMTRVRRLADLHVSHCDLTSLQTHTKVTPSVSREICRLRDLSQSDGQQPVAEQMSDTESDVSSSHSKI
jgi:hypothetical protein